MAGPMVDGYQCKTVDAATDITTIDPDNPMADHELFYELLCRCSAFAGIYTAGRSVCTKATARSGDQ